MILEAKSAGCFSWTFVLKLDDRPIGKLMGRWFTENLEIHLTERRHLGFRKISWFSSQFDLVDLTDDECLARCDHSGIFTSSWNVSLSVGNGQLVRTGWFDTAYEFIHEQEALARVDRLGWCERGWIVDGAGILTVEDHLFIGLIYQIILQRQNQQQAGHTAGS
jgi:hypothetical protein